MSPGDLYFKNTSGSFILLLKKGDWIDFDYLKKFEERKVLLFVQNQVDISWVQKMQKLTLEYLRAKTLSEKEFHWNNWLIHIRLRYWENDHPDASFELKVIFQNLFYTFGKEFTDLHLNRDLELFNRYLMVASDNVFLLLLIGNNDYLFLRKIYMATLRSLNFLQHIKLTPSIKQELNSFFQGQVKILKSVSIDEYLKKLSLENNDEYWQRVMFEDLRGMGNSLNVIDNEVTDVERILIFTNRTRKFVGVESEECVLNYFKKHQLKFMSPHLLSKINCFLNDKLVNKAG